jgi:uncharacterized membrane protein (DUF485 family)
MALVWVVLIWVLNLGISVWNAYAVGRAWVEVRHAGGWPRFLAWMGAVMSACGFTWCYLLLLAFVAYWAQWLTTPQLEAMINLGYVLIIPGVLFSGLMITIDSWAQAYRRRTLASFGTAAYNTFAQIHNTYHAISDLGRAFRGLAAFFQGSRGRDRKDRDDAGAVLLVVLLVLLALFGGILTTAAIIRRVAGREPPLPTEPAAG